MLLVINMVGAFYGQGDEFDTLQQANRPLQASAACVARNGKARSGDRPEML